jgi:hypothetical protein
MSGKTVRFSTRMTRTGVNTTGVVVPTELIAELGAGARPPVIAKINDYVFRTTVGVMNGRSMLSFSAQHREASGIGGDDPIEVQLSLDTQPRIAEVPEDLAQALAAETALAAAFEKLAPSRRKAIVENVVTAKSTETRARRIAAIIDRIRGEGVAAPPRLR